MTKNIFSPYAPVRLHEELWWTFSSLAAKDGYITASGQIAGNLPEHIMDSLVTPMTQIAGQVARKEGNTEHMGLLFAKLLQLRHWVPMVGQYILNGRQIFDLNDLLVPMLRNTDVADCTLEDWRPPYDSFFVRFGKQLDMKLPFDDGFEFLDGAFVAVTPWDASGPKRRIKIGLTTVKEDGSGVMLPGYFIDFTPDEQALSPREAVKSFIARKFADLDSDVDKSDRNLALIQIRKGELEEGAELLASAAELVVNCLFYIESMGAEKELTPGRDVPPALHVKWQQSPQMRKYKVSQKIYGDGYAMVRMMGDEIQHVGERAGDGRADVSTHWRRGHWRRQAHGPQKSLVKRVWIRPVLVNPAKPHEELPGHVYAVGSGANALH